MPHFFPGSPFPDASDAFYRISERYARTCVTVRVAVGYLPSPAPNTRSVSVRYRSPIVPFSFTCLP